MSAIVLLILRIALALALYLFLGWALYTLWQDLKRQSRSLAAPAAPPIALFVDGDLAGKPRRFTSPEILVGRDPAADLSMNDKTISAQHARLSYHHAQWWVEDLHSTNGTYLNQELVAEPMVLTDGDELRFGQVVMDVSFKDAEK